MKSKEVSKNEQTEADVVVIGYGGAGAASRNCRSRQSCKGYYFGESA